MREQLENFIYSNQNRSLKKIAPWSQEGITMVSLSDICFIKSDGNYCRVHLCRENPIFITMSMKDFESLLPPDHFYRVHQRFMVNLIVVKKLLRKNSDILILENGEEVPVAIRRKEELVR